MAEKHWSGGTDTDWDTSSNWLPSGAPSAGDDVIMSGAASIAGEDKSSTELGDITIAPAYAGTIGSADTYLQLDQAASKTTWIDSDLPTLFLDLGSSGSSVVVNRCRHARSGQGGLYLRSETSAIQSIDFRGGGTMRLESGTYTSVTVRGGGTLYVSEGVTVGALHLIEGSVYSDGEITSLHNMGGEAAINGSSAMTLVECSAGNVTCNTTGTITDVLAEVNGRVDFSKSREARTVTTVTRRGTGRVIWDPAVLTITNPIAGNEVHEIGMA